MSRSFRNRHTKNAVIIKIGGDSDKKDKRVANRKFRRYSRICLYIEDFDKLPNSIRDVSDTWNFRSDGLAYYMDLNKRSKYSNECLTELEKIHYKSK